MNEILPIVSSAILFLLSGRVRDNVAEWYAGIEVDALDFDQAPDRSAGIFAAVRGRGMTITRAIQC